MRSQETMRSSLKKAQQESGSPGKARVDGKPQPAAATWDRRHWLQGMIAGTSVVAITGAARSASGHLWTPGVFAEELTLTPAMTEGPFYPDKLPLDTDNDLLQINDGITPAVGEVTYLSGRVLTRSGSPVRNALVEIWQVDNHGSYLHSRGANPQNEGKRDSNFQGYGRFLTNGKGEYFFRTIKPVPYPGRTPHIHFAVTRASTRLVTTQMLIQGEPANERDGLFRQIRDPQQRQAILAPFRPVENSRIGELEATWDIVVGWTPEDDDHEH